MWRVRILRVLLPALLVPFLLLVALELRPRRGPAPAPSDPDEPLVFAEGVELLSLEGARRLFDLKAQRYLQPDADHQKVEGVERLDLFRDGASPLRISADVADIRGEAPDRVAIVKGGLDVRDDEAGMALSLPTLEIREAEREARSLGEVAFRAPGFEGRAEEVVYPLDERPAEFHGLELSSAAGDRMRARRARFLPGSDVVELSDDVRFSNGPTWLESPAMTVRRDPEGGWVRDVEAGLGVRGEAHGPETPATSFRADRLEATWTSPGELGRIALLGRTVATQADRGIAAANLAAVRTTDADGSEGWDVVASGGVVARADRDGSPATLRAATLTARADLAGNVLRGDAIGAVRFEHGEAFATADRARLRETGGVREVTLVGEDESKARLAEAERRVAAETVRLRPGTQWMRAEGRAEATLLPRAGQARGATSVGMFRSDTAIHFVARSLESSPDGGTLNLEGNVRGWQGERNLAAGSVRLDRRTSSLLAEGDVATRFPAREGAALSEADYVQVTADRLQYREADHVATYEGGVRVRQDLGWMECRTLEARMRPDGDGLEALLGSGDVELDYRSRPGKGTPEKVRGRGDRVRYDPEAQAVWLYGDERPAEVRTSGPGGGTTYGRVLRYGLEDGSLEIEGGVSIRTGDGGKD